MINIYNPQNDETKFNVAYNKLCCAANINDGTTSIFVPRKV